MHVDEIRRLYKDKVYVTTLLRHTYRDNGKTKQKTLANLSALPPDVIAVVKAMITPVRAAVRSEAGREKVARAATEDGLALHSFATLLGELATVTRNLTQVPATPDVPAFWVTSTPTPVQRRALELAGADLTGRSQKRPA